MLVLAGCVGPVPPSASDTALVPAQLTLQNCREFTAQVTVEGQSRQAVGQTCQQPDGSWQVTLNTPGLPQQVYTLPPQAIYLYPYPEPYYWWDPWFYGPLLFVGSPVFLAHGFHRHHDFHHNGGSHNGGSHNGGSHNGGSHHGGSHGGRR
jgi:hypothetical protein